MLLLMCLLVTAAGCANGASQPLDDFQSPSVIDTFDTKGLAEQLQRQLEIQTDTVITAVDCPDDVEIEAGGTFECTAEEKSGATFTIKVTQTDRHGNVEWEVIDASK